MSTRTPPRAQPPAVPTDRIRWFNGRFLTAADLTAEQDYLLGHRWMHNRLFHGSGIVCGLQVTANPSAECAREWVQVQPGIAIDCQGREIVIDAPVDVYWEDEPDNADEMAVLCVRYSECPTDQRPVIAGGCHVSGEMQGAQTRAGATLELHPVTRDGTDRWSNMVFGAGRLDGTHLHVRHDCSGTDERDGCLSANCDSCDECVALAVLFRHETARVSQILIDVVQVVELEFDFKPEIEDVDLTCHGLVVTIRNEIDVEVHHRLRPVNVRTMLPPPAHHLTHIVNMSWRHGATIDPATFARQGLWVQFDRELQPGVVVDDITFRVDVEGPDGRSDRAVAAGGHAHRNEDGSRLTFTPFDLYGRRDDQEDHVSLVVYVTLLGDLIHDCRGLPVDADFFGRFPSGDGVQGGTFRSWFRIKGQIEKDGAP